LILNHTYFPPHNPKIIKADISGKITEEQLANAMDFK
jgi:hypothetical protein